jgi:hypothetical protein
MISGAFNDLCSTVPTIETLAIRTYAYPSGALLSNTTYGNGANVCLTPHPGYLDSNISNIDYEIDYRVRDAWQNWSTPRRWRGWFYQSNVLFCSATAVANTLSDSDY